MKRGFLLSLFFLLFLWQLFPENGSNPDLVLSAEDMILDEGTDGGYHLWVRKKPALGSVLLTESTMDPGKRLDIFALRDPEYNPVNGNEKRLLDGKFLEAYRGIVDSTPEEHEILGLAFHLFIPYVVVYGYPWSRSGEIQITAGAFLNVKTFSKPYADWTGETRDNPFVLRLAPQKEQKVFPEGEFNPATVEEFTNIARDGGGKAVVSAGKEDLVPKIRDILEETAGNSLDLVLALDTTLSMKDEMPYLKEKLAPLVREFTALYDSMRVGILFYRDYFEQYLVKIFPFSDNLDTIQEHINRARVHGGKELPEAVYEALYAGLESYTWQAESKIIILVGDAPPHPKPRGSVTEKLVYDRAKELGVILHTIILPQ